MEQLPKEMALSVQRGQHRRSVEEVEQDARARSWAPHDEDGVAWGVPSRNDGKQGSDRGAGPPSPPLGARRVPDEPSGHLTHQRSRGGLRARPQTRSPRFWATSRKKVSWFCATESQL